MTTKMRTGWLWMDARKDKTLEEKVLNAVEKYQAKFNHAPNTCYVHPKTVEGEQQIGAVHVVPAKHVLLHHFWLGVSKEIVTG